jgi:predicted transcriptional regulator
LQIPSAFLQKLLLEKKKILHKLKMIIKKIRSLKMRKLGIVDLETGEILAQQVIIGKKPTMIDKNYVKVFITFLEDVIKDEDIVGKAVRLLLHIINKVDWNTLEVYIFYKEICKELDINDATFYRWLNTLIEKEYIEKTDKKYIYKIKPYSFIKGDMKTTFEKELNLNDKKIKKQKEKEEKQQDKKKRKKDK